MIHPRRGGTGISWTRLLSDSSAYFSFCAIASQPMRPMSMVPTAASAPLSSSIRREKVIDWWALVSPNGLAHRPSLHASMRDTSQALKGKTQIEMTSGGTIIENGTPASSAAASRHCNHSSIASNTAARIHSIQ